ncbi:alkaline phosphatase D family protein [Nocardioides insulae]|uniref:alkaline phosphatase D family protein n=1 Tax=Nocardioides insulae TaxID=394734 RepID=UPI0009FE0220|nr:alkaline phosphatase D family protein [Nocardioides insulae]
MVWLGRRDALRAGVGLSASAGLLATGLATSRLGARSEVWRGARQNRRRIDQPHGARTGDVTAESAVIWARAADDGRMVVQLSSNGRQVRTVTGPVADPRTDRTARIVLRGLEPGREYAARVWFAGEDGTAGRLETVRFRTAPRHPTPVSFAWSGDTCGQGWGIETTLGLPGYGLLASLRPDFFLHVGDTIYADEPMVERDRDDFGHPWTNELTESVSRVAQTLEDFRGRHRYVLSDPTVQELYRQVPTVAMWDDHETLNNWYPGEIVDDARYDLERSCDVLAARGRRAWAEYQPVAIEQLSRPGRIHRALGYGPHLEVFCLDMRSYRDPNGANLDGSAASRRSGPAADPAADPAAVPAVDHGILGAAQAAWLLESVSRSRATWKVIAADMPLSVATRYADDRDSVAQFHDGGPRGREQEIARLLSGLQQRGVRNVIWVTADVHYTAAHEYHPDRAAYQDFDPFWEFVSGPVASGTFPVKQPDRTFGPRIVFAEGNPDDRRMSPAAGKQYVGQVEVGADGILTVTLHSTGAGPLWSRSFEPEEGPDPLQLSPVHR